MTITIAQGKLMPGRIDISPADLDDARMTLRYAQRRTVERAALLRAEERTQWPAAESLTIVIHGAAAVFADEQCRQLAEQVVRQGRRSQVFLRAAFCAADMIGPPHRRMLSMAACGGSPTLHAAAQLATMAVTVDGQPVPSLRTNS